MFNRIVFNLTTLCKQTERIVPVERMIMIQLSQYQQEWEKRTNSRNVGKEWL